MRRRQIELGGDRALWGALAHQPLLGPGAQRQAQRIEQDGFAGAGLAGQHAQARCEIEIEAIDQDDVADGQASEHGSAASEQPAQEAIVVRLVDRDILAGQQAVAVAVPGA